MTTTTAKIVRILSVRDTRCYDEGVVVPGSGDHVPCDRCGSLHAIHFSVELSDGSVANVGSGCATKSDMVSAAGFRSAAAAATKLAKLESMRTALEARIPAMETLLSSIEALAVPDVIEVERNGIAYLACGDASVRIGFGAPVSDYHRANATTQIIRMWREKRFVEAGGVRPTTLCAEIDDITGKIAKVAKKLAMLSV